MNEPAKPRLETLCEAVIAAHRIKTEYAEAALPPILEALKEAGGYAESSSSASGHAFTVRIGKDIHEHYSTGVAKTNDPKHPEIGDRFRAFEIRERELVGPIYAAERALLDALFPEGDLDALDRVLPTISLAQRFLEVIAELRAELKKEVSP